MNKRGISAIVATVLIVLISVAGVAIIWVGVLPMVDDALDDVNRDVRLSIVSSEGYTVWDPDAKLVAVQIERKGDGDACGLDLIFVMGGTSVSHYVDGVPEINARRVYYINLSDYPGGLSKISVAPVFCDGSVGDVISSLEFGDIPEADIAELIEDGVLDVLDFESPNGGSSSPGVGPVVDGCDVVDVNDTLKCYGGNVHWYDDCEDVGLRNESCSDGCSDGVCVVVVEPFVCEENCYYVSLLEDTSVDVLLNSTIIGNWTLDKPNHGYVYNLTSLTNVDSVNITFKPYTNSNYFGKDYFQYNVSDGISSEIIKVNVTIEPDDDAPIIRVPTDIIVGVYNETPVEKVYKIPVSEIDGDSYTYSSNLPSGITLDSETGELRLTVSTDDIGSLGPYTITVTDNTDAKLFGTESINIIIRKPNLYYLNTVNGDDSWSGNISYPWKTLNRSRLDYEGGETPLVKPGDTIIIKDGSYGEFREIRSSRGNYGDWDTPLTDDVLWTTYKAAEGHNGVYFDRIYLQGSGTTNPDLFAYKFEGINIIVNEFCKPQNVFLDRVIGLKLKGMNLVGPLEPENDIDHPCPSQSTLDHVIYLKGYPVNNDITIEDSNIFQGYCGINGGANNLNIINCDINMQADDRMRIGGNNLLIEGNLLHDPIESLLKGDILKPHSDCMQFGTTNNVTIRGNKFYDHSSQGVWFSHGTAEHYNTLFENNIIYNTKSHLWTFHHMINLTIRNNTMVGYGENVTEVKWGSPIRIIKGYIDSKNVDIYNNIFVGGYGVDNMSFLDYHDYNIWMNIPGYSPPPNAEDEPHGYVYGYDTVTDFRNGAQVVMRELFVDPDNGDFRPLMNSPACNGSVNDVGVAVGALGCI